MSEFVESDLVFVFRDDWKVNRYDEWSFYKTKYQNLCGGQKAIDFLAIDTYHTLWLIEAKDYRRFPRTKGIELCEEFALKVTHTLSGLVAAKFSPDTPPNEKTFARDCLNAKRLRVVLHLEQPIKPSKLFPRSHEPTIVRQKLKQLIKPIDPHPKVTEIATTNEVDWSVTPKGDN